MPVAILPDISEQHCIGCALCVEICTALGPDVLRVKPVEGWKRGKAFVFYPERCISDGACIGVCPTKAIFWMRPMEYENAIPVPLKKQALFKNGWEEREREESSPAKVNYNNHNEFPEGNKEQANISLKNLSYLVEMDLVDIKEASRQMNLIYNKFQELQRTGRKSEVSKMLASKDFDSILTVNSIAKKRASDTSDKEEREFYNSAFDKSSEMLNTLQKLIEENMIDKIGKQNFEADMESWKKYLGEELFEKSKRLWI